MIIKKSDTKKMPWKNGKGVTEVIADSGHEPFLWKLSAAEISESAPFSDYVGYNRFLTVIEGKELKVKFEKSQHRISLGEVVHFSGDKPTSGEILKGPVKDLGLIYLRDRVKADFQVFEIGKKPRSFSLTGTTCFIFLQAGEATASLYPGEKIFKLKAGDTLRMDASDPQKSEEKLFLLEAKAESIRVVLIEIEAGLSGIKASKLDF